MNVTTLPTWADRKAIGDAHEQRVAIELERRGWTVAHSGQGILPEPITRALGRTDSPKRWEPDLICALGSTVCLIDAKSSMRGEDAHIYTISRKALRAQISMAALYDLPIYYVFANLGTATPAEVMQFARIATVGEAGGYITIGSGLVRPFDDTFGNVPIGEIRRAA